MLSVLTLSEANALLDAAFPCTPTPYERVPLALSVGRILSDDLIAGEDVPGFARSTVDGYAVVAADTFGCSESIPALLSLKGTVDMGALPAFSLSCGECAGVPTGGGLPRGADAVVMMEYTEHFGCLIAMEKPAAPGQGVVFAGDDVKKGSLVLPKGTRLTGRDVGALAALGHQEATVVSKPRVAVLSTGDELVSPGIQPLPGQIRDVNGPMLAALCAEAGAKAHRPPIIRDQAALLTDALQQAASCSDLILLSGGSSVGQRDEAAGVISELGTLLFHGLAVKPGKPTMAGQIGHVPVIGLPGHPVAAYMLFRLMALPFLYKMQGRRLTVITEKAVLIENIPSNHGREEYMPVRLKDGIAQPAAGKSGLIMTLAGTDGYIRIERDAEGLQKGDSVTVYRWETM